MEVTKIRASYEPEDLEKIRKYFAEHKNVPVDFRSLEALGISGMDKLYKHYEEMYANSKPEAETPLTRYKKLIEQIIGPFDIGKMQTEEEIAAYAMGCIYIDPPYDPVSFFAGYMTSIMINMGIDEYVAERNYEKYGQDKKPTLIDIILNEKIKKRVEEEE